MNTTSEGILCPDSNQSNSTSHILTADKLEAMMNYVDPEPVKTAITALYKKGDIIEVRAWDKQHNVYTGRYTRSKKLMDDIKLWNEQCDVYYVLNPVGNKHGLRDLSKGGLCTWEQDVPWRRYFLLDFDPKRDSKIATHGQWAAAFDAAYRSKVWLDSFGFKGIILANSGNGCHLLVPCDLPNDSEGKEIVRKVQRIVSNKFSTADAECECFPDANRLVRAYGTVNMKGAETETLKHRMSEILVSAKGTDEDPKKIFLQIIAENPIADAKAAKLGNGEGPFSRDLLYARLEAWAEKYEGENGEHFNFEETDRRDGFRILCPGNTEQGWPDGEQHETVGESLNDSCIVYVENGWPRLSCRHNHCGEGAAHGKKTWKDLQEFYDKERKFHRIMDETDYAAVWNIDYVDDGAPDAGEADVEKLTFDVFEDGVLTVEWGKPLPKGEVEADEKIEVTTVTEVKPEEQPKKKGRMPEPCMYGWLGWAARELKTPLGFAYPAMLTAGASLIQVYPRHVRPTLYTCLIGGVHSGKSETIKRAIGYRNQPGILNFKPDVIKWTVPGSDRGLIKIFGADKKEDKTVLELSLNMAPTRLLAQDELRNTIAKANIQNSALPSTLCSLWEQDEAGAGDKIGEHTAVLQLNILGALKADDAEDFAEVFGKDTTSGLYDRFIYGLAPAGWEFEKWEHNLEFRTPKPCTIPDYCWEMMKEWRRVEPIGRGRLGEIAMRIAYITSAMNHDPEVTAEAMRCALEFCEWQEWIRTSYKAGLGDTIDAQCTNAILTVLEKLEPGMWIRWKEVAAKKNWYRKFSARTLSSTRDALTKSGMTIEEETGNPPKRTGRIRLRVSDDDSKVTLNGKTYTDTQAKKVSHYSID